MRVIPTSCPDVLSRDKSWRVPVARQLGSWVTAHNINLVHTNVSCTGKAETAPDLMFSIRLSASSRREQTYPLRSCMPRGLRRTLQPQPTDTTDFEPGPVMLGLGYRPRESHSTEPTTITGILQIPPLIRWRGGYGFWVPSRRWAFSGMVKLGLRIRAQ